MNLQLNPIPTTCCVSCLSSDRTLNYVNDAESKWIFNTFLQNSIFSNNCIPLCYECMARLKHVICFKKLVNEAHKYLMTYIYPQIFSNNCIPLCYECMARLKHVICFKKQVNKAHKYLMTNLTHVEQQSMSKLSITKPETHEWQPTPTIFTQDIFVKRRKSKRKPSEALNLDSDHDYDNPSSELDTLLDISDDQEKNLSLKNDSKETNIRDQNSDVKQETTLEAANPIDYIKIEPVEDASKEYEVQVKLKEEEREYEFDESDDEPLKNKKRKKKVKKEAKEAKRERPAGVVSGVWVQKKLQQLNVPPGQLEMVVLSWEEVELERQKSLTHTAYTRHEFRCQTCIIGFNHRFKLETHMKKHQPEAGDLECSICKSRFKTQSSLLCHRRRHRSRWRCARCQALFSRAGVAADHHARAHHAAPPTHACRLCDHTETSLGRLRVHLKSHAERQHCEQCGKTFRDKSSLRTHLYIHTNQKDFACEVCDKRFRFKKALEIHRITHEAPELLYCKDCDLNFKNRLSFYQHINYSMKHIHPDKIKYACEFCSRRFSKPARLEEHRLSIHLKLTPHRCTVEGCTFASASRPALRTHIRMVHRNKRFERNHVCHTCGKAYTTKKILEGHIRSHTGERPFTCTKCPATFSHDAALYNHNKLVHKTPFVRRQKQQAPTEVPQWAEDVQETVPITNTSVVEQ